MRLQRILIVDDEPAILRALTRLFRRNDFDVHTAANATEALGILDGVAPDVVISDFKMPGMNGLELLRVIGERFPGARRILLSGYAEQTDDERVLFLGKPYDAQALLRACR